MSQNRSRWPACLCALWFALSLLLTWSFAAPPGDLRALPPGSTLRLGGPNEPHGTEKIEDPRRGDHTAYALSNDGRWLASARVASGVGHGSWVRVWDVRQKKLVSTSREPRRFVRALAFSPDGDTLVTVSPTTVVAREVPSGNALSAFESWHEKGYRDTREGRNGSIGFSPGGGWFVTGRPDTKSKALSVPVVWEAASLRQRAVLPLPKEEGAWRVAASPCGRLVAGVGRGKFYLWDLAARELLWEKPTGEEPVWSVAFSPDGGRLCTLGSERGKDNMNRPGIKFWVTATGECERTIEHDGTSRYAAFSREGKLLATCYPSYTKAPATLWDARTGEKVTEVWGHEAGVCSVIFTPDGKTLITGSQDSTALFWDLESLPGVKKALAAPAAPPAARPKLYAPKEALTAGELKKAWADLAGDAEAADRAIWKLALRPAEALRMLAGVLKPAAAPDAASVERHLAALDAEDQGDRERASAALAEVSVLIASRLRRALASAESLEAKKRLTKLVRDASPPLADARLRPLRAVEAVAHMATPEAYALLRDVAKGAPDAPETRAAKAALARAAERVR